MLQPPTCMVQRFKETGHPVFKSVSALSRGILKLTKLKPEEVQLLVFPPTRPTGNRMQERVLSFDELAGEIQLTQLCEKTYLQYLVAAGKKYKVRPNVDDGWRTVTPLCQEYSISRYYQKAQALAAIPEVTIIGSVLEVHIVKNS